MEKCEDPFYNECERLAEKVEDIKIEEIIVSNNLSIKNDNISYYTGTAQNKIDISFEDILLNTDFGKILKKQYEDFQDMMDLDESKEIVYIDYVDSLLQLGKFEYVPKWAENLTLGIDLIPGIGDIKTLIDGVIGYEFITGRDLDGIERVLYTVSAIPLLIDCKNVAFIIKNLGGEEAIEYAGKQLATNIGFYAASQGLEEVGVNPLAALLLYQTGRATYKGIKSESIKNGINNLVDKVKGSAKGSLGNSVDTKTSYVKSIADLKNTDNFRESALEHILEGEINKRGKAVGFHYEGFPTTKGNIIEGTKSVPDELGIYTGNVEVNGIPKTSNGGQSTFFPEHWTAQDVVDAINEAYINKSFVRGNTYIGTLSTGMKIEMFIDQSGNIISAYPKF